MQGRARVEVLTRDRGVEFVGLYGGCGCHLLLFPYAGISTWRSVLSSRMMVPQPGSGSPEVRKKLKGQSDVGVSPVQPASINHKNHKNQPYLANLCCDRQLPI